MTTENQPKPKNKLLLKKEQRQRKMMTEQLDSFIFQIAEHENAFFNTMQQANEYLERLHAIGKIDADEYEKYKKAFSKNPEHNPTT